MSNNVAIYIDHPNIRDLDYQYKNGILLKAVEDKYGDILKCNSYWAFGSPQIHGDPIKPQKSAYYLYENNINFIPVPSIQGKNQKNPTDTKIVIDIMEDLYQNDHFDTFVILTSDRDFIPILKKLIEEGKEVIVIMPRNSMNLHEFCDKMGAKVLKLSTLIRKYGDKDA